MNSSQENSDSDNENRNIIHLQSECCHVSSHNTILIQNARNDWIENKFNFVDQGDKTKDKRQTTN